MVIYNDKAFYMSKTHSNFLVITIDTYFCIFDNLEKAEGEELGGVVWGEWDNTTFSALKWR